MDRAFGLDYARRFVAALALLPVLTGMAAAPPSSPDSQARHQNLRAVADDYWEFYLRENPEVATVLGEYRYNAKLTDYSLAHVNAFRTRSADLLARAQAIDAAGLSDTDRLDQQLLVRTLSDQLEFIRLKNFEMPLNQMDGVHLTLPQIATIAPFDSVAHYRDYIARLNAIPVAINHVIERSRAGLKDGLVQPRFLLEKTVVQCAALADAAGASNPFAEPAGRIPESFSAADRRQLREAIIAVVDG
jgi:uncharacterized protein (DUF885 family)